VKKTLGFVRAENVMIFGSSAASLAANRWPVKPKSQFITSSTLIVSDIKEFNYQKQNRLLSRPKSTIN